ncbi:hypothetical protein EYF80_061154 [Liparis tanakae]|uniref:Uncharacterized protein n=1 Tax=Liparis tanakae TaxID=230148 RepID=A0A4Z2EIC4_9TELE|nr:hypothetical protein EYF80_061154 [Liparis tanakae]
MIAKSTVGMILSRAVEPFDFSESRSSASRPIFWLVFFSWPSGIRLSLCALDRLFMVSVSPPPPRACRWTCLRATPTMHSSTSSATSPTARDTAAHWKPSCASPLVTGEVTAAKNSQRGPAKPGGQAQATGGLLGPPPPPPPQSPPLRQGLRAHSSRTRSQLRPP